MKKAFTLIELLAVIVILALIMVIAVPQILGVIEKTRENAYKLSADLMRRAAETYVESGKKDILGDSVVITLDELVSNGFMSPIKDLKDKSTECIGYVEVKINSNGINTYTPYLKCGDNYVSNEYNPVLAGEPVLSNANIHETVVPDGYTGIYKIEDLNNMRNNLSGSYILMNDLDFNSDSSYANLSNKPTYTTGNGWLPIGNSTNKFIGTLNGNNHVIKNLYINRPTTDYVGLFGYIDTKNAIIQRLGLETANVTGKAYVGGLVGQGNSAIFQNIYTTGTVIGTGTYVGGIVGKTTGTSTDKNKIENCYSTANVTGNDIAGGVVGYPFDTNTINSFGAGNITTTLAAGSSAGGLVGATSGGGSVITNSYRSSSSQIQMVSGTPNAGGTLENLTVIQNPQFIKYVLGWDTENIWYVEDWKYPTLGGTKGTINFNYNIAKIEDLYMMRYDLVGNYILMNDLDFNSDSSYANLSDKPTYTTGTGWLPIGNSTNKFKGTLNGNNHVIKNLYINRPTTDYVGLFGYIDTKNAIIQRLGLETANVTGRTNVGGLVGQGNSAIFQNIYTTGTVIGTGTQVGGIVGRTTGTSTDKNKIENCYSTANVTGNDIAGGVVGYPFDTNTINSFGAGNITTTLAAGSSAGGLVGATSGGGSVITNSYRSSSSQIQMVSGTPNTAGTSTPLNILKTQLYIKYQLGWDIGNIWYAPDNQYPKLGGTTGSQITIQSNITKIEDLYLIRYNLSGSYTLMNDLDFNNVNDYRNPVFKDFFTTNLGWTPIGTSASSVFSGNFNGNNHVIKNLYINRPSTDYIGLFGYIASSSAVIEKVGLENVNIKGGNYVGGLVGRSSLGVIKNSYTTGNVLGTQYVGGLLGYTSGASGSGNGSLSNSYSTINVTGTTNVGGLIGYIYNNYNTTTNSYATGNITANGASAYYGKLIGSSNMGSTITNCYYSSDSTITGSGTLYTLGTSSAVAAIQPLTLTGLNTWDTSTIWKVNSGAFPTFR